MTDMLTHHVASGELVTTWEAEAHCALWGGSSMLYFQWEGNSLGLISFHSKGLFTRLFRAVHSIISDGFVLKTSKIQNPVMDFIAYWYRLDCNGATLIKLRCLKVGSREDK